MDLYGNLTHVQPLYESRSDQVLHGLATKMKNSTTVMIAAGDDSSMSGPRLFYDLATSTSSFFAGDISGKGDAHDIQFSKDGNYIFQPVLEEYDAGSGDKVSKFSVTDTQDVNHCQLIDDDTVAVLSSRSTNSIVLVNASTGETIMTVGGEYSDFDIVDLNGVTYGAGSSLWHGQHNAEYYGEHEYFLFDNELKTGNNSRLLVVRANPHDSYATLVWEYVFDGYSPVYGDNDLLANGDVLGVYWPNQVYSGSEPSYDAQAVEVDMETKELAWEMKVNGYCDHTRQEGGCERGVEGWTVYSIERFYTAPLVYSASCTDDVVSFTTQNNFKQVNLEAAVVEISDATDGTTYAAESFEFAQYWRPTTVEVTLAADATKADTGSETLTRPVTDATDEVLVTVTNQWGDSTSVSVSCRS